MLIFINEMANDVEGFYIFQRYEWLLFVLNYLSKFRFCKNTNIQFNLQTYSYLIHEIFILSKIFQFQFTEKMSISFILNWNILLSQKSNWKVCYHKWNDKNLMNNLERQIIYYFYSRKSVYYQFNFRQVTVNNSRE